MRLRGKGVVMRDEEEGSWCLMKRTYLGDMSALCLVCLPGGTSIPFLLAGTGPQILLYDMETGKTLSSFHVFDGIRVHGIRSSSFTVEGWDQSSCRRFPTVAVFGERRVKLFDIQLHEKSNSKKQLKGHVDFNLLQKLPKFGSWVMDVRFLKGLNQGIVVQEYVADADDICSLLAIGLSDNSVCLWDITQTHLVLKLQCTERCLLYSMSMWGDSPETLRVASGTIYNEILTWKLVYQQATTSVRSSDGLPCSSTAIKPRKEKLKILKYETIVLNRLIGHEGSIFQISWSYDGSKLISVSDDRSARVWRPNFTRKDVHDPWAVSNADIVVGPILFGHGARIWDCYISDAIIITASEDCTCRIWGLDGKHLATIKEHTGRGIWRCGYDPGTSILVTAGSDSAIKMRHLNTQAFRHLLNPKGELNNMDDKMLVFNISVQRDSSTGTRELMDSKSEYVRCLHLAREDCLYVATNLGYLHCIDLTIPGEERWSTLLKISDGEPICCFDLNSQYSLGLQEDWIAIGDGKGRATIVEVVSSDLNHEVACSFTWSAERERQLLGIYWCKSLGHRHAFTTDPKGGLKLWRLKRALNERSGPCDMVEEGSLQDCLASLIAEFTSSFSARIVCVDASFEEELLVCGDQHGNIVIFSLRKSLLVLKDKIVFDRIQTLCSFRGAHGISTVSSISVATSNDNQIQICSTGRDGCICSFIYDKDAIESDSKKLVFTGIKKVSEITAVEGVITYRNFVGDVMQRRFAVGFTAADFLLWDITNESELLRVSCGGWRRPYSYFVGTVPEVQNCFAYVKNHSIYVHKNWVPDDQVKVFPPFLHLQFHGREIHSVQFIPVPTSLISNQNERPCSIISWIATGSEDGTVRITRYSPKQIDKLSLSVLLGEHIGGSAVRSITTVSKIHTLQLEISCSCYAGQQHLSCTVEKKDTPLLLLSVGAKRVLTCWLLNCVQENQESHENGIYSKLHSACMLNAEKFSLDENYIVSFRWLTTSMPPRVHKPIKKMEKRKQKFYTNDTLLVKTEASVNAKKGKDETEGAKVKPTSTDDETEDDWRYLAVTAFMVQGTDCRSTICFVVVACSNGTLGLRALLLPDRLWFEVAVLDHQRAPVLTLQHVVVPVCYSSSGRIQNVYLVFGGTTNGSITVWDLTEVVTNFSLKVPVLKAGLNITAQRRPCTGRGSHGGRRLGFFKKKDGVSDIRVNEVDAKNACLNKKSSDTTSLEGIEQEISWNTVASGCEYSFSEQWWNRSNELTKLEVGNGSKSNSLKDLAGHTVHLDTSHSDEIAYMARLSIGIPKVHPLHVFHSAHQSGVNCLHIAAINGNRRVQTAHQGLLYCVVSGGDDQAIHIASFGLQVHQHDLHKNEFVNKPFINERIYMRTIDEVHNYQPEEPNIVDYVLNGADNKSSESDEICGISGHTGGEVAYEFTCLSQETIHSAHSSSVKGVWTDGLWVFSTGLDQRIRCWHLFPSDQSSHLTEHCSSVINVPEPEALHSVANKERNQYRIAVVGRGMQIIEFSNHLGS